MRYHNPWMNQTMNFTLLLCNCWAGFIKTTVKNCNLNKNTLRSFSFHPQEFGKRVKSQLKFPPLTLWLFAEVCHSEQNQFCLWGISALKNCLYSSNLSNESVQEPLKNLSMFFGRERGLGSGAEVAVYLSFLLFYVSAHLGRTPWVNVRSFGSQTPHSFPQILPHWQISSQLSLQCTSEAH